MPDPEIEEAARFLATHALLLLGLGIVAAAACVAVIVVAVRSAAKLRPAVERFVLPVVRRVMSIDAVRGVAGRAAAVVPNTYLAVHLSLGLVAMIAVGFFVTISAEVIGGGEMAAFDLAFADALYAGQSDAGRRAFSFVSLLGAGYAIGLVTLIVAIVLLAKGRTILAFGWIASQAGGGLLNMALKGTFERARPEFADPLLAASSWSFPSGHAMGTFIFCGVGCYLLLRDNRSLVTAAALITAAAAWCVVMAFSRLYLGVHFASDVIAGMIAGVTWVTVCVSAFELLRRRTATQHA